MNREEAEESRKMVTYTQLWCGKSFSLERLIEFIAQIYFQKRGNSMNDACFPSLDSETERQDWEFFKSFPECQCADENGDIPENEPLCEDLCCKMYTPEMKQRVEEYLKPRLMKNLEPILLNNPEWVMKLLQAPSLSIINNYSVSCCATSQLQRKGVTQQFILGFRYEDFNIGFTRLDQAGRDYTMYNDLEDFMYRYNLGKSVLFIVHANCWCT